jgi:hypothetical protein
MIKDKLTIEQQNEILGSLFGFELVNISDKGEKEHWVLYDDDGNEFYGTDSNCQFDFSTLAGIFSYTAHVAEERGFAECQFKIKSLLNIKN